MTIQYPISLKRFNSFAVQAYAAKMIILQNELQIPSLIEKLTLQEKRIVLGEGSNVLFTQNFNGTVIVNRLKGKVVIEEDENTVTVQASAGENWHDFVCWTIDRKYYGLENLSLIPGTVGASPVQNIGAYGVELDEFVDCVKAIDLQSGAECVFTKQQCQFEYRGSIFKKKQDRYLITSVRFKLHKTHIPMLSYADLKQKFKKINAPTASQISLAVCEIRKSKLPLPQEIGNAGSFFKNPIVSEKVASQLKLENPALPIYEQDSRDYKISAAWLIEQCGFKGFRQGDVGVYDRHALVLVNYGNVKGNKINELADLIRAKAKEIFNVTLEAEPRII